MTKISTYKNALIALLLALIALMLYLYFSKPPIVKERLVEILKADTIERVIVKEGRKIYLKKDAMIEYKTVFIADTIYDSILVTKPFIARLDTIIQDTINISYEYPENKFEFIFRACPDTLIHKDIVIEVNKEKTFYEKYIEKPLWFTVGVLTSFIIYKGTK